jgi:hypothetical protein
VGLSPRACIAFRGAASALARPAATTASCDLTGWRGGRHRIAVRVGATPDGGDEMPAKTEKQRKFMAAELERKREGKKTRTGMSEKELEKMASKPTKKKN